MSPRTDVSEERKNQILDAAATVFARSGFSKARMDDIVQESGLSKGALYWYFQSKDEIILAILDRILERELSDLRSIEKSDGTASDHLLVFTDHVIADMTKILKLLPITYEFLALATRHKTVQQALKKYFLVYLEVLTPIIQQGIERGEFQQVDPLDVAITISSIFEGTILLSVYDSDSVQIEKHIRSSIHLLLEGLKL